jgi:soluble lytic murein transglycosylase-like protein
MHGFRLGYGRFLVLGLLLAVLSACADGAGRHANGPFYNRPDSTSPPGPPGDPWGPWIRDASRRFDVPDLWIREVMRQESGGRPGATSRVGAMGLMQVMPGTYRELAQRYNLGPDPYHPYDNLQAGAAYLREMYQLYGNPAFLAAYNAGPACKLS